MNFAQMLMTPIVALRDRPTVENPKPERQYVHRGSGALRPENDAKHAKTVALYKTVVREEWTATVDFENRLGKGRSTVLPVLKKWEQLGIVEHRPIDGVKFNRSKGLEWRFK